MNEIDKFFSQFIGQSQGQGRFLRLSVEDNLVGGTFIGRKGNQDYLKVKIDGLQLTGGGGVQSVTGLNTNNSDPQNPIVQISIGSGLSGNGTPSSPLIATGGGGTVTGATISGALSVSGSVTLAFAWTGTTGQYVRGDGSLATFPTIPSVTPSNVTAGSTKISLGGTPTGAALQAFSIDVSEANLTLNNIGGTLGISKGGTNLTALGTANQLLRVNAGATALEYFTPTFLTTITVGSTTITSGNASRVLYQGLSAVVTQTSRFTFVDATSGSTRAELLVGEASINNIGGQLSLGMSDTHTFGISAIRFGTTAGNGRQWNMSAFGLGYTFSGDGGAGNNFNFTATDRQGTMRWSSASGASAAQKLVIFASDFAIGGNTYTSSAPNALRFAPANGMRIDLQTNLTGGDGQGTGTPPPTNYSRATALLDLGASTTTRASLRVRMGGAAPTGVNLYAGDFYGIGTRDLNLNANLVLPTVGDGIKIKEGTNATMGIATLVAGVVVVSTTKVTASSRIFLTRQTLGTILVPVDVSVTARIAGTSFTITSADLTDTSTVSWIIFEPS